MSLYLPGIDVYMNDRFEDYSFCLAKFCDQLHFEDIPPKALHRGKLCILDTIGNILGASVFSEAKKIISFTKDFYARKESTVIGFNYRTSLREAAFANGTMAELLELQDGGWRGNHPSSVIIPAALALGEAMNISGKTLLTSVVAGYEVANRICGAVHPSHQMKGFTPTSTGGTFGASAAAAKILGFDQNLYINSLGIAGFLLPVFLGETLWKGCGIKPVHAGQAAKVGIESALLAKRGFTGWSQILGGPSPYDHGLCNIMADNPDFSRITEGLGRDFTIQNGYFKQYPSCRLTHGAVDAVLEILNKQDIQPDQIEKVCVKTFSLAARMVGQNLTTPSSSLFHCQFSLPYIISTTILNRSLDIEQFKKEAIKDGKVHKLATKVRVEEENEFTQSFPKTRSTRVEIFMASKKTFSNRVDYLKGDPENPLTENELSSKFTKLASYRLDRKSIENIISTVYELDGLDDVSSIFKFLSDSKITKCRFTYY